MRAVELRIRSRAGLKFEDALLFRGDPDTSNRGVQMPDEGLGARLKLVAQRLPGCERRAHIRSGGDLTGAHRISRRREMGQIRHHSHVFGVEAAARIVRDDPDRSDRLPTHVERDQQPLFNAGLHGGEVLEIPFGA